MTLIRTHLQHASIRGAVLLALCTGAAACGGDDASGPSTPVGPHQPEDTPAASGDGGAAAPAPGAGSSGSGSPGQSVAAVPDSGTPSSGEKPTTPTPTTDAGADQPPPKDPADPALEYAAVTAIRNAFRDNDYGAYNTLAKDIDAAAKSHPDDPTIARYAAVLRLWRLTEASRDPKLGLLDLAPVLIEAEGRFDTARRLAPSDGRLVGWSAALTLRSGQQLGLAMQVATGKQELADSVATYPAFNSFVQGAALAALPRSDPDFALAPEKMLATLKSCGVELDPQNPVFPADAPTPAGGVCGNSSYVPHNLEGLFLNLGDALVKAGKPAIAKIAYQNARSRPSFESWPYRSLLEQRIANADANAASYQDSDASNDFKMPIEDGYFCVGCHATKL
jgi:hypothetical protein